ncbi:MAG: hypothetical protein JWR07_1817 [Nevskia sp.]|nr:hypothetical protein [Nevskia sp.]
MNFRTSSFAALFDANVLFSPGLTSLAIDLALTGLYRAKWTARIHEEWVRAVYETMLEQHGRERADQERLRLDRRRALMDAAVPDCLVEGYEFLEPTLALPDPHDRHVLAAAIYSKAAVIVTYNLNDFPAEMLARHGVEAQHPDDFFRHAASLDLHDVIEAVRKTRQRRRNPTYTVHDMLAEMRTAWGLTTTADMLAEFAELM